MNNSFMLRARLKQLRGSLFRTAPPRFDSLYPSYLLRSYCVARSSVPLLRAARAAVNPAHAPKLARPLRAYFLRHMREEQDHAQWLLEDLAVVGVRPRDARSFPASASVASSVGAQYYWIAHGHPLALLGYMAVLESSFPSEESVRAAMSRSRFPGAAFRSWLHHASADPHHSEELLELIDSLPLNTQALALIDESLMCTIAFLTQSDRDLTAAGPVERHSRAAQSARASLRR